MRFEGPCHHLTGEIWNLVLHQHFISTPRKFVNKYSCKGHMIFFSKYKRIKWRVKKTGNVGYTFSIILANMNNLLYQWHHQFISLFSLSHKVTVGFNLRYSCISMWKKCQMHICWNSVGTRQTKNVSVQKYYEIPNFTTNEFCVMLKISQHVVLE